jgi:hypothetical protein
MCVSGYVFVGLKLFHDEGKQVKCVMVLEGNKTKGHAHTNAMHYVSTARISSMALCLL